MQINIQFNLIFHLHGKLLAEICIKHRKSNESHAIVTKERCRIYVVPLTDWRFLRNESGYYQKSRIDPKTQVLLEYDAPYASKTRMQTESGHANIERDMLAIYCSDKNDSMSTFTADMCPYNVTISLYQLSCKSLCQLPYPVYKG